MPGEFVESQLYFNRLPNCFAVVFEIVTEVSIEQFSNASEPMLVTEFGIATDVKLEQPWNALKPMLVTEFGIITDVKLEHSQNAP